MYASLFFLDDFLLPVFCRIHRLSCDTNGKTAKDFLGKSSKSCHATAETSFRATGSKGKSSGTPRHT